jgi:hypothetical protein
LIRLYFPRRVMWRSPVEQDQRYFGVEIHRLFFGFVLTTQPKQQHIATIHHI